MKKINKLRIAIISLIVLIFSISVFTVVTYSKKTAVRRDNISKIGMKIIVNKKEYNVKLENNETVLEILKDLPLDKYFVNYEDAFYSGNLPMKVAVSGEEVNKLEKNHVYYHPGWGGIVIVYKDYEFTNEKLIHIGTIKGDIKLKGPMVKIKVDTNEKKANS